MALGHLPRYAVVGNPIAHSWSPRIHRFFARQTGIALRYGKRWVPIDGFAAAAEAFFTVDGGVGLNVSAPFKRQAYALADKTTFRARLAGAVNTLDFTTGKIIGDNTDGVGLLADLQRNLAYDLRGKKILLWGAGGAARGVLASLLSCQPRELFIANRTAAHAANLALEFSGLTLGVKLEAGSIQEAPQGYDLLLCASAEPDVAGLAPECWSFDLVYVMRYGPGTNKLLQAAQARGIKNTDGLGMLVEQAAHAFAFWHGIQPKASDVLVWLRSQTS
jgi:shikimate dehydrogenase